MKPPPWDAAVPAPLATRMNELLRAQDSMLDAAIHALRELVTRDVSEHASLELLAIDGLVTGAFAGVTDPAQLEALADGARARLMALGDGGA